MAEIKLFKEQANVLIVGKKRSGKTCLGWSLLKEFGNNDRKMYVYKHPNKDLLDELPFKVKNLTNLKQISNLNDAVVLIDEAQKVFPIMEKTVNSQLRNILSLSAQNNICFIFICHNTYFLNRSLFTFIDIKIIKEVNEGHWELERSYMKKLYSDYPIMGCENFFIDSDEIRGVENFEKPPWFSEKLSFAYRVGVKEDFFKKIRGKTEITLQTIQNARSARTEEKCGKVRENSEHRKNCDNPAILTAAGLREDLK